MAKSFCYLLLMFASALAASEQGPVRVYADICGDLLHAGHMEFFKKARSLGDELIIGVLADEDVASYKRAPVLTLNERVSMVKACRYVDEVIVGAPLYASKEYLQNLKIDVVVHGDDFDPLDPLTQSQYGSAIKMGIFKQIPYTDGISTTEIIERIIKRSDEFK